MVSMEKIVPGAPEQSGLRFTILRQWYTEGVFNIEF